ncbi:hypothetical protein SGCOL_007223 [Colletotrichum sp. CLE4]
MRREMEQGFRTSKAYKRRIADRIVHVGFLTADSPLAKRREYRTVVVPTQRRAGSSVFLKVDTHLTTVVTFDWLPNFTRNIDMQQAISK